jgi:hypothetical protein
MTAWISALILIVCVGGGVLFWYRAERRRRIAARRVVERPNSHYSSQGVVNQVDRDRWGGINLPHLHPLNRSEVERLLSVIDRDGVNALSSKDRLFLDNMTRLRLG